MTFAAPIWLVLAGAAALGVLIAHLFSPSVPARDRLPTTRFIPHDAPLAVLRTNRLSDWLLLVLRLAVCVLLGLALASAHIPRSAPARVTIVDASRAVGSVAELRDSARAYAGDVIIVVDSVARRAERDALAALTLADSRGSLSAGLVAAHRALQGYGEAREDAELVIVSPVVREEIDSATARLMQRWEGRVSLVHVAAATVTGAHRVEVRAEGDDPVAATFVASAGSLTQRARVVRTTPTARDSAWARDGGVLVVWPARAEPNATVDTAGAVIAGEIVVVTRFARHRAPAAGRVIARWNDGAPAATEATLGRGCVRDVTVPVDPVGDLALRASFREFAYAMAGPCGGARDFAAAALPAAHAPAPSAPQVPTGREPLWFALAALAILLVEQGLRSRRKAVAA